MSAGTLTAEHAARLARFRIPPEMLESAEVRSVTDAEARDALGLNGHRGDDLGGILFPYRSPVTGERTGGRIRPDHPLSDGGKYMSEPGCRHLFFSPGAADFLRDVNVPVVIVEAEKSALALTALAARGGRKMMVIAIGGCWGWRRKMGMRPSPDGSSQADVGPSPDFELITWEGRCAILVFDSNARTNPHVQNARRAFARELSRRKAYVLIAEVPAIEGVNGPDDLVAVSGDDAMLAVLDSARPVAECAATEAKRAIALLEANKKADPLPAIEAMAAIENPEHRALLIGRLVALKLPGATRKFIEQQVRGHRAQAEADRQKGTAAVRQRCLMAMKVEGADLLEEVYAFIRRFVWSAEAALRVVASWIVHTHAFDAADCTPYLSITSAEKRSGKSRLLEVLETLVQNPWYTGRVTAAVLYRKIDEEEPTLLLDEGDAAFKGSEEYSEALRGILNSGHRRGGQTTCCVRQGVDISYQNFSTFSPKAIAGIGKLPDTVADRSISIRLKRKTRNDKIERFRLRNVIAESTRLRERLEAWSAQNIEALREARPELPEELSDRQQDGAEPLLAIADAAGGDWPQALRQALVALCTEAHAEDSSIGVQLLTDIRQIFEARAVDRISSADLVALLAEIETSPWADLSKGKSITPNSLARLLAPYGTKPHNVRIDERTPKGYLREDFEDAWGRYLQSPASSDPRCQNATAATSFISKEIDQEQSATLEARVADQEAQKPTSNGPCGGVAVSGSQAGEKRVVEVEI